MLKASPQPTSGTQANAMLALIAGAFAMGLSPIFVRFAVAGGVGPYTSAFWRVLLALPLLWLWMQVEECDPHVRRQSFPLGTILAGAAFTGDLFFWHLSIVHTTVANATFFATTAPVWVVIAGFLIFRHKVAPSVLAGLVLCLAGGASLMWQSMAVRPDRVMGDLFGVATAIFFGLYFLCVQSARGRAGAARVTFELSLVTAALLFVIALITERKFLPDTLSGALALLALAWLSHAGGQGLLSIALGRLPVVFSSLVIFLEALAAAFFGWLFLHEPVTWIQIGGGLLILIGIWVARPREGDGQIEANI
ncbi:DMT family transporter [Methylovirgula sp. 4M-Z18]|uniref:DMT family transporter n=1 Tax=Methylovirgula sp. 4M-Z18 TaxID=2293567 RepID=UPI000E2F64CF|nr:DMT family transporter [Methylovirgula sp. 4M-Z18]RFB81272.1 DMT family transporter [Methylovirgula sp. 4M-Z18]